MTLPELAIKRHVTTLMIIVSLVVLGGVALMRLPLAFLPDVERPYLFVRVPYANASGATCRTTSAISRWAPTGIRGRRTCLSWRGGCPPSAT
jgi:multidrug efflux pump subunit AcrB